MGGKGHGKRVDAAGCLQNPPHAACSPREPAIAGVARASSQPRSLMGTKGDGMRVHAPGSSANPPGSPRGHDDQSPPMVYKRRKTGIQRLNDHTSTWESLHVKAYCSSSISKVCDIFASFDAEKRGLVEDIGFGGMLRLPSNTEVDPVFSLWLMRSVETSARSGLCLHSRNVNGMICRDIDVHFVLGVPFEGSEIALDEPVQDKIVRVVRKLLHVSVCSFPISMAEVEAVMLKRYGDDMSYVQRASFKIAVILFAVTHFLAPNCYTPEFANPEILKHLLDPDNIKNVNWAGYFINCIKREAARLKDELRAGRGSVVIHACPAILKVFYLDNMAFGEQAPVHDLFPRISAYTSDFMSLLVASDTKKDSMSSLDMYGITKVREKSDVCYSRGFAGRSVRMATVGDHALKTANRKEDLETSSDMHDLFHFGLKLIDEHAISCSEMFKAFASAKELAEESIDHMRSQWISYFVSKQELRMPKDVVVNPGPSVGILRKVPDTHSSMVRTTTSLKKMGELRAESGKLVFKQGVVANVSSGNPSVRDGGGSPERLNDIMQNPVISASTPQESALYSTPVYPVSHDGGDFFQQFDDIMHPIGVSDLTSEEMALYATPADPIVPDDLPIFDATPGHATAGHAPAGLFDGNVGIVIEEEFADSEVPAQSDSIYVLTHSLFGASPFSLGLFHAKTQASHCRSLQKVLDNTDAVEAQRVWFRHTKPVELAISCSELRCAFYKEGRFSVKVVDGLSRLFMDLDMLLYKRNGILENTWRHWMPASFAQAVIDGEDCLAPRFRDLFVGTHLGYNVANCRMLIMPLPKNGRWATYVWDFMEKVITVLDPYLQGTSVGRLEWVHDDTMHCLNEALFQCRSAWINGWEVDRHGWRYNHPIALGRRCRDYNTGVYAMHYALHFDGDQVTDLCVEGDHGLVRADWLHKMLTLPGNTGDLPSFLTRENA